MITCILAAGPYLVYGKADGLRVLTHFPHSPLVLLH